MLTSDCTLQVGHLCAGGIDDSVRGFARVLFYDRLLLAAYAGTLGANSSLFRGLRACVDPAALTGTFLRAELITQTEMFRLNEVVSLYKTRPDVWKLVLQSWRIAFLKPHGKCWRTEALMPAAAERCIDWRADGPFGLVSEISLSTGDIMLIWWWFEAKRQKEVAAASSYELFYVGSWYPGVHAGAPVVGDSRNLRCCGQLALMLRIDLRVPLIKAYLYVPENQGPARARGSSVVAISELVRTC